MPSIPLDRLYSDARNANVCKPETLDKIKFHMAKSLFCPAILVRPHPKKPDCFILVDGHHRVLAAKALGWLEIECQVKEMTRKEAGVFLLTLNRLRGEDIPRKRAELMESLLPTFGVDELAKMLPESKDEIAGLLALLKQDDTTLEAAFKAQMAEEAKTLPVPFGFMVSAADASVVREALNVYQEGRMDQGQILVAICRDVLKVKEVK